MKCDFCSATPVTVAYHVPDFVLQQGVIPGGPAFERMSAGGWAACAECAALIDAGDEQGVIDRSTDRLRQYSPRWKLLSREEARHKIAIMQQRFFTVWQTVPEECRREEL